MVYDDLFHVWQLLLTFGWVICLQQAGDQVLKAARESVGTSVQVLYKPVACIAFTDFLWPNKITWPRPDQINVEGDCQSHVS